MPHEPRPARSPGRRRRRTLLVLVLGALAALVASPAAGHDRLVASSPADGATLTAVPASVTLTYSDDILPTGVVVEVRDAAGTNRAVGTPTVSGPTASVGVDPAAPAGAYTVVWRVVSSDGHPIEGTVAFTLALPSPTPTPSVTPTPTASPTPDAAATPAPSVTAAPAAGGLLADLPPVVVLVVAVAAVGAVVTAVVVGLRRTP